LRRFRFERGEESYCFVVCVWRYQCVGGRKKEGGREGEGEGGGERGRGRERGEKERERERESVCLFVYLYSIS